MLLNAQLEQMKLSVIA